MDHETTFEFRRRTRWYTHVGDFMNTLKAFIGTNYQGLAFAFSNSGLAVGVVGVFAIAAVTDHCCQILIRSKMYLIDKIIKHELAKEKITESDVESLRERLELAIGYGDVAMRVYGPLLFHVTQAVVCFTQFMVCVMYFVFIANTVTELFPMKTRCDPTGDGSLKEMTFRVKTERGGSGIPMLHVPNLSVNLSARYRRSATTCNSSNEKAQDLAKHLRPQTDLNVNTMSLGEKEKLVQDQLSSAEKPDFNKVLSRQKLNDLNCTSSTTVSTAPDLRLVVLFPLPVLILTSLIRNVRYLAPISSIATFALFAGAISVLGYVIKGFHVGPFDWYKVQTLPLFLCQIIAGYEGIGCVLPIQSSMVGCRHLFPAYLHANVGLTCVIFLLFGCLGYLSYGNAVKQMIVLEIPQHMLLSILVDIMLIISVLFTYPLQCYPVLEIMESAILLPSHCCRKNSLKDAELSSDEGSRHEVLVQSRGIDFNVSESQTTIMPATVPIWKRNVIRVGVTLVITGLAVVMRDYFAYIAAITGALGASFLAFILPCLIDIRLRYEEMSRPIMIKNIIIIVVTIIVSILGLVVIAMEMAKGRDS